MAEIVKDSISKDIHNAKIGTHVASSSPVQTTQDLNKTFETVNGLIPRELPIIYVTVPNPSNQVQIEVPKTVESVEISHGIPNKEKTTGDGEENVMHLPVVTIEHYNRNEGLLDEGEGSEMANALVRSSHY
jgi:hypothetical protein